MGLMDIAAYRRECDRLMVLATKVIISDDHLKYGPKSIMAFDVIDIVDDGVSIWLHDRGYRSGGIVPDNPMQIWIGNNQGQWQGHIVVYFHPDRSQDAMLFKLTWG